MILEQLSTNHLNRLAHFLQENTPLPQQSYKETKQLLKQLIKNLIKEIRFNIIELSPEEISVYDKAVYDFLSEADFIDIDRLLYFEHVRPAETAEEIKITEKIWKKGVILELLEDTNPYYRKKKLEMCIRLIDLYENECLASIKIWKEFRETRRVGRG